MTIRVKVIPRSARSEIAGELRDGTQEKSAHNGLAGRGQLPRVSHSFDAAPGGLCALKVKIAAQPVKGKANELSQLVVLASALRTS